MERRERQEGGRRMGEEGKEKREGEKEERACYNQLSNTNLLIYWPLFISCLPHSLVPRPPSRTSLSSLKVWVRDYPPQCSQTEVSVLQSVPH